MDTLENPGPKVIVNHFWIGTGGLIEFKGEDREAVQEQALACFTDRQNRWQSPSYPSTHQEPDGLWRAAVRWYTSD